MKLLERSFIRLIAARISLGMAVVEFPLFSSAMETNRSAALPVNTGIDLIAIAIFSLYLYSLQNNDLSRKHANLFAIFIGQHILKFMN